MKEIIIVLSIFLVFGLYCAIIKGGYNISRSYYRDYVLQSNAQKYHYKEGLNAAVLGDTSRVEAVAVEMKRNTDLAENF